MSALKQKTDESFEAEKLNNTVADDSKAKDEVELKKVRSNIEIMDPIYQKEVFYSTPIVKNKDFNHRDSLFRIILADIGNNFYTYMLGIVLCVLALFKVDQVQDTRYMIAKLNEVTIQNENLNKTWLNLLAKRQNLSEHSKIRADAYNKLKMHAPKTEAEKVIYID